MIQFCFQDRNNAYLFQKNHNLGKKLTSFCKIVRKLKKKFSSHILDLSVSVLRFYIQILLQFNFLLIFHKQDCMCEITQIALQNHLPGYTQRNLGEIPGYTAMYGDLKTKFQYRVNAAIINVVSYVSNIEFLNYLRYQIIPAPSSGSKRD